MNDLITGLSGSPYYNINTTYYQTSNTAANKVKNTVTLGAQIDDIGYSLGKALSDAQIQSLVTSAIGNGALPKDPNGLYFVLTTKDVNATSGMCSRYCGWHNFTTVQATSIKYAYVGDTARCLGSCASQSASSPNGNPGVDGMASVLTHELEEAATDPELNAWADTRGQENADKCAWTFGTTYNPGNGSKANMKLGARDYLIQRNWVNASGGYCDIKY